MKDYRSDRIHNIALVGHSGAGKTTLTEAALYLTKVTTRMGKTEDGNTVSDFDPEEVRRGISISTSLIPVEWDGHKINFLDTPGSVSYTHLDVYKRQVAAVEGDARRPQPFVDQGHQLLSLIHI